MSRKLITALILFFTFCITTAFQAQAQIRNPLKSIKRASEEKADENIEEGIDKGLDGLEEGIGNIFRKKDKPDAEKAGNKATLKAEPDDQAAGESAQSGQQSDQPRLYSKYDFVPGDTVIFEDLLANEKNGEFPSKWDLKRGNVEIGLLENELVINFPSTQRADIVPLMKETGDYLSEKFTIELDVYFSEFCTKYTFNLYDMVNQKNPEKLPEFVVSPWDIYIQGKGTTDIQRKEDYPYWQRIAISFNTRSLKVYLGEQRIANIPNLGANPTGLTIAGKQCHDGQFACIRNIRIAQGSMDLYERVVTDGKFVTNGIRFDVGKATIKPESMGVINEIVKLMREHADLNFSVEGHTDSDGDEAANLKLSEERAASVKQLLAEMGVDPERLATKGFGESKPLDSNTSPEGKANNRRVEFIKI